MARGFRGVRDDLTELGRHLVDIACFLHPLLSPAHNESPPSTPRASPSPSVSVDMSGSFRGNQTRVATRNSTPEKPPRPRRPAASVAPAVSDDVVEVVAGLSANPDCWLKFPMVADEVEFTMSSAQRDHIIAVQHLVPDLEVLRFKLCPSHMTEDSFWKIYFALLHGKLNDHESESILNKQEDLHMKLESRFMLSTEIDSSGESDGKDKKMEPQYIWPRLSLVSDIESVTEDEDKKMEPQNILYQDPHGIVKTASQRSMDQWVFAKTRSQQSMDQWSEIPSDIDTYKDGKRHCSSEDLSLSDVDGGNGGRRDHVEVLDTYIDSLLPDRSNVPYLSSSIKHDNARRKPVSSVDFHPLRNNKQISGKSPQKKGSADWHEDSEFEVL